MKGLEFDSNAPGLAQNSLPTQTTTPSTSGVVNKLVSFSNCSSRDGRYRIDVSLALSGCLFIGRSTEYADAIVGLVLSDGFGCVVFLGDRR